MSGNFYPPLDSLICAFNCDDPASVLMFGDSVAERVSHADVDRRTLVDMVAHEVGDRRGRLVSISKRAFNPVVYLELLRALQRQSSSPRTLIVPVNLRCFSPQWHFHPDWQMAEDLEALAAYRGSKPADVALPGGDQASYRAIPVDYELSECRTIGSFQEIILRKPRNGAEVAQRARELFIFHYTHRLERDHPKLTALIECAEYAMRLDRCVFYLTPINIEGGRRHVGPRFADIVAANARTVKNALESRSVSLFDFSGALPERDFLHDNLTTEHLNQSGRAELARLIARAVVGSRQSRIGSLMDAVRAFVRARLAPAA